MHVSSKELAADAAGGPKRTINLAAVRRRDRERKKMLRKAMRRRRG
jgi:hypothetical protein